MQLKKSYESECNKLVLISKKNKDYETNEIINRFFKFYFRKYP